MADVFAIRRISLSTDWTPITCPFTCSGVTIGNGGSAAIAVRTDRDESDTEDSIAAGMELAIESSADGPFAAGSAVAYASTASGSGPAVVRFTR